MTSRKICGCHHATGDGDSHYDLKAPVGTALGADVPGKGVPLLVSTGLTNAPQRFFRVMVVH